MANLKDIRERIKSVKSIKQVTKAMKMVAAAKMRRAQENMEKARPYSEKISDLVDTFLLDEQNHELPEVKVRDNIKKVLFVVITSDRGMAGAFNTNVLKIAHKAIDDFGKENAQLICIGKKSATYFKSRGYNIVIDYIDFWNTLDFDTGLNVAQDIISRYMKKDVDRVQVIYNKFINVAKQEVCDEIFLPITHSTDSVDDQSQLSDIIYEPNKKIVIDRMIPRYLNIIIWQYLLESNASEQAARMLAMENATSNADDMIKELTLQFNKARQTAITTEMLEIVSGAEALN
tara:strand:- start:1961 stop:2827 length:867 start_codon:yes stop_codon:yes gene_type:complete